MKSHVIVSVLLGFALPVMAELALSAAPVLPSEAVPVVDVEQQALAAMQKYTTALERVVPILMSIKDKPSAELHAFDVANMFIELEASEAEFAAAAGGLKDADFNRIAPDAYRRYKFRSKQFRVQLRRLSWADHYDCLDLRTAMGEEVKADESEPEKERPLLPEEQVQQLAASVANAQALYLSRHRNVQGGPGFSRETAWIMLDTKMSVIAQEYEIMKEVIRQTPDRQSLVYEGERWYDLLEYDVKVGELTYTVDQWFDITLHADTMNARAQAAAQSQGVAPESLSVSAAATSAAPAPTPAPRSSVVPIENPLPGASVPPEAAMPQSQPESSSKKAKRSRGSSSSVEASSAAASEVPAAQSVNTHT